MAFLNADNPPQAGAGAGEFTPNSDDGAERVGAPSPYRAQIVQGALAGIAYGVWAIADAYASADFSEGLAASHAEAFIRALIVFVPTALLLFRRGAVSGLALTALASLNAGSLLLALLAGDADEVGLSFVSHLPFAALFARAAWAARKHRKQQAV